jgi:hypothetical protein
MVDGIEPTSSGYELGNASDRQMMAFADRFTPPMLGSESYSVPEEIDPRPWHRIENQGQMGSCQGHANSSVCEMAYHIATGEVTQFSPMFAYLGAQKFDGLLGRDNGSTIDGGAKSAMQNGSCPAEVFPYPSRYSTNIPPAAYAAAKQFLIQKRYAINSYADAFAFLSSGQGGIEIGISWNNSCNPINGLIERYSPNGGGGHAIALLGYSRRKDNAGRNYLWLANSWAPSWGNAGWAEVSPNSIETMVQSQWGVFIGLSDLTTPRPRRIDWTAERPMG